MAERPCNNCGSWVDDNDDDHICQPSAALDGYRGPTFSETDTIANLTEEQLQLLERSDGSWVVEFIKTRSIFDAESVRLLLELGKIEARRRLETR